MINFILWLLFGGVTGWFASIVMRTNTQQGPLLNIVTGIVGAFLGGFVLNLLGIGGSSINNNYFSLTALVVSFLGAVVLLAIVNLVRRGTVRGNTPNKKQFERQPSSEAQVPPVQPASKPERRVERQPSSEAQVAPIQSTSKPEAKAEEAAVNPKYSQRSGLHPIFVSYRRDDTADVAGRIYDRLIQRFTKDAVFKDVDSIPLGIDFRAHLSKTIGQCSIVLVIIGRQWLTVNDQTGQPRLNDPRDFVRIEIEAALQRDIRVIPLLVQGAAMPTEANLPASLRDLTYRNGVFIHSDPDFHRDMDRLIQAIEVYLGKQ